MVLVKATNVTSNQETSQYTVDQTEKKYNIFSLIWTNIQHKI